MNDGNFFGSLREVVSLETTILWNSLLKEDITCSKKNQTTQFLTDKTYENLKNECTPISTEISKVSLGANSEEVAVYIAGYVQ